jgi:tetratricopeptide (TPR) repeat protein
LAPESSAVRLAVGYYYLWALGDVGRALEEFELAEKRLPNSADALEAKAAVHYVLGRWNERLAAFQSAQELSPLDANLATGIASSLWMLRRYPEAIDACDRAIELAPEAAWPYLYKAFVTWSWWGATAGSRAVLEAYPADVGNWIKWAWYYQDVYEGRYQEVIDRLQADPDGWIRTKMVARPNRLLAALVLEFQGEPDQALELYEKAAEVLESEVESQPEDPRYHSSLGITYAALDRKDDAIRAGLHATELLPRSKDGFYYQTFAIDLAHIYAIVGDVGAALKQVEYLLSNPGWMSVPFLEMDPRWNSLRENPAFQALLEKYR